MYYTVGWNMPGYLPEMEPYTLDTPEDAKQAMIDELLRHADNADDQELSELATSLSNLADELDLADVSNGWSTTIGGLHYWIEVINADQD